MLTLKNQPKALYGLSFTAVFERFAYYVVHCTLVLFLIQHFFFSKRHAYDLFGAFTAFMYLMTPVGGYCADKWLGIDYSIVFGAVLLGAGYAVMGFFNLPVYFYVGLATVAVGNGFFQPTIAMAVGRLYRGVDWRRNSAFLIFYAAINVGAVLPPLLIAWLAKQLHVQFFYTLSAWLVFVSIVVFYVSGGDLKVPLVSLISQLGKKLLVGLFALGLIVLIFFTLKNPHFANICLLLVAFGVILYVGLQFFSFSGAERSNLIGCLLLIIFSILFWALYQQQAMSLLLFTKDNVHRTMLHYKFVPELFLVLNPFLIIVLTPLLSKLWSWLAIKGKEPGVVVKFALGTILVGLSFLVFPMVMYFSNHGSKLPMVWLVFSYGLIALGELCLSPVGLSMIATYSPDSMRGTMMGLWYLASAAAFALSGFISDWTIPSHHVALYGYLHVFSLFGLFAIGAGMLLWFCSKYIRFIDS